MEKYTLPQIAAKFVSPALKKNVVYTLKRGQPWYKNTPAQVKFDAPLTINGGDSTKLIFTISASFTFGYNVSSSIMYLTFDGLKSDPIDVSIMNGQDNAKTYTFTGIINVPQGKSYTASQVTVSWEGYQWGYLQTMEISEVDLQNKTEAVSLNTIKDCLTVIADYVRTHPELGGIVRSLLTTVTSNLRGCLA